MVDCIKIFMDPKTSEPNIEYSSISNDRKMFPRKEMPIISQKKWEELIDRGTIKELTSIYYSALNKAWIFSPKHKVACHAIYSYSLSSWIDGDLTQSNPKVINFSGISERFHHIDGHESDDYYVLPSDKMDTIIKKFELEILHGNI